MISRLFEKPVLLACALLCLAAIASSPAFAQKTKPINAGEILSGELTAMRSGPKKNRTITYQLTSEPRRLPPPAGLCNLESGPETRSSQIATPKSPR